jgi:archaellum biogenesis ATPase FlaH
VSIPQELKAVKQWIVWKENKRPYSAVTMSPQEWQKKDNWTTYNDALRVCREHGFTGIGFVFSFPYVGIDLDRCIEDDGLMNSFSSEITKAVDTFTEYSRSGKGLHLYCKVTEPIKALKTDFIEIYGEGRYFIATGKEFDAGQLEVTDQTVNIKGLIAKYGVVVKQTIEMAQAVQVSAGGRNNRMTAEVGRMFNYWDKATVHDMAHTLNQSICKPPLGDQELDTIIESMSKREVKQLPPKPMQQQVWEHIDGKRDLDKMPYKGIARPRGSYISTGIESLDYAINDLAPGCVTLVTGRTNGGKSTLIKQIIANAISGNNKVFSISGEGDQELSINALYECVIGTDRRYFDSVKINKRYHKEPKEHVLNALKKWHEGKLTMFNKGESKFRGTGELFEMVGHEVKTNHYNLIIIDNLMSILTSKATEKNEAQADFMQRCHDLANLYKIHIILVLHPNKEYRKGEELEVEQISGTSDLYNKADNIIAVIREYKEEKTQQGINGKIVLLKNRYYPNLVTCDTHFDHDTGLLLEIKDSEPVTYAFNWERYLEIPQGGWEPAEKPIVAAFVNGVEVEYEDHIFD